MGNRSDGDWVGHGLALHADQQQASASGVEGRQRRPPPHGERHQGAGEQHPATQGHHRQGVGQESRGCRCHGARRPWRTLLARQKVGAERCGGRQQPTDEARRLREGSSPQTPPSTVMRVAKRQRRSAAAPSTGSSWRSRADSNRIHRVTTPVLHLLSFGTRTVTGVGFEPTADAVWQRRPSQGTHRPRSGRRPGVEPSAPRISDAVGHPPRDVSEDDPRPSVASRAGVEPARTSFVDRSPLHSAGTERKQLGRTCRPRGPRAGRGRQRRAEIGYLTTCRETLPISARSGCDRSGDRTRPSWRGMPGSRQRDLERRGRDGPGRNRTDLNPLARRVRPLGTCEPRCYSGAR